MSATKTNAKTLSLHKSRNILVHVYSWYKKYSNTLPSSKQLYLENEMEALDQALLKKDRIEAGEIAYRLEEFSKSHCKKTIFESIKELSFALAFALVIAILIRQMWFEPYEIPTGSMRPTFREQDHLIVTKTSFGVNVPLATEHFLFDPALVQRGGIVIFSGDGLPLLDSDSTYFGIFPYKKRYIKRCLGKPGDSIYFYGGQIYAVDINGNDLEELRTGSWIESLEYIPYLSFEGTISQTSDHNILLKQMYLPAGKLSFNSSGQTFGEVFNGKTWVKDQPDAQNTTHGQVQTYSDLFGIRNFAMAQLLTKQELVAYAGQTDQLEEGVLYLQLHHTPSLNFPKAVVSRNSITIPGFTTVIPLQQHHLDLIMDNLYTSRFIVEDTKTKLYGEQSTKFTGPILAGVPDGTYEFYSGKASLVNWGGILSNVPIDSPLYDRNPLNIQKMYNFGIEMNLLFSPTPQNNTYLPRRYAYFRDGDLYLMGVPILKKSDKTLIAFNEREENRVLKSTSVNPYVAFKDYGPPLKNGTIDKDFIRTFGFTIPKNHYLTLGDNHARSGDSRVFGFVPEENLQGAPCWIIWPPGERLGDPIQKPYPFMNIPRAIVWTIVGTILTIWFIIHRRNLSKPVIQKKMSSF